MAAPLGSLTKSQLIELEKVSREQPEAAQLYWVWRDRKGNNKFEIEYAKANRINLEAYCYFFINYFHAFAFLLKCQENPESWHHENWTYWLDEDEPVKEPS